MEQVKEARVLSIEADRAKCPINLDKIHCQNCYYSRDGECHYEGVINEQGN